MLPISNLYIPPLAYSITRYNVFSVSMTWNSFTENREKKNYKAQILLTNFKAELKPSLKILNQI